MKAHKSQRFLNNIFPGWNYSTNYEFADLGRIWVAWNPAINLTIHSKSSQMMTYLVQLPNSTDEVVVSYIYGLNCKYGRHHLWDEINCLARDPIIHGKP